MLALIEFTDFGGFMGRIAGSVGSPKVWTQRSTPLADTRLGCERRTFQSNAM